MTTLTLLLIIVLLAGFFMTWNIGANDVANAIGTSVGSGSLTLRQAVVMAAILEFCGAVFFGSYVSDTIEGKLLDTNFFSPDSLTIVYGMLSVLLGAGSWLLVASYYGLPVSTTHSMIGAMVGFGAAIGGIEAVYWDNVITIACSWILSPLFGGALSYSIFVFLRNRILFVRSPLQEAKKWGPIIVFIFLMIFSLLFVLKDFERIPLQMSVMRGIFFCIAISALGVIYFHYQIKKIALPALVEEQPAEAEQELVYQLNKAHKHLNRVQLATKASIQPQIHHLLDEIERLKETLKFSHQGSQTQAPAFKGVELIFSKLQIMSAALMAFAHGANDVANGIGPLAIAVSKLLHDTPIPSDTLSFYLLILGGLGIVTGLATWGWRVIYTIGRNITELTPTRGFAAEFGAAFTVLFASRLGLPISATHTLVGSVLGVGFARGMEALNLATMRDILVSWIVTIPIGALTAIGYYHFIQFIISS